MNADVRGDFPLLERRVDGKALTYLDSAATALKPRTVIEAQRAYETEFTANIHRGKHLLSQEASSAYERARQILATWLETDPATVVFTLNATDALNLVAEGLSLSKQDRVVTTINEHHSNLVPWMARAQAHLFKSAPDLPLSVDAFLAFVEQHQPRVVALAHASNVSGVIHPVREICERLRDLGIISVVDAAQSAPHVPLRPESLSCDFLALSGHKMLGPAGTGLLWGRPERLEALRPTRFGGGTVDRVTAEGFTLKGLPYRLEGGTPNISGAIGLGAAAEYLDALGWDALRSHERGLADALERALKRVPGVRVVQSRERDRLAVATVIPLSSHVHPDHLARVLSEGHQTLVRSGFFCAHPLFDGLMAEQGGLRLSAYVYNTVDEIDAACDALRRAMERLGAGHG
jgi:cysteine desulfurase/selenocysteine lyase